ncbi:polymer-forming cytoskeletal protein [Poritiphilus flavus]|uniref:Polymer-forming cytoskeletal protein n=1 Tax=Poritiphilus flavus TaxID=2697053 RepID=A0A6L9EC99_9FLAO|nr:polymer-forming cytoskeletal protein [Poritiphilus flavus]NAS12263.1 hypothetical protein [Poritiphilus flavus]
MKTRLLFSLAVLLPVLIYGQYEAAETITVSTKQNEDIYLAGESINVNAMVNGDVVVAGGEIVIRDTIAQDLVVAGGDIVVRGIVKDDIRAAGGTLTISEDVGDDVIVFGGKVSITEEAKIQGNLVNFSGEVDIEGEVVGMIKASGGKIRISGPVGEGVELYGGDIKVDGEIRGNSKIVAEELELGENARFFGDVEYWTEEGEIDFKNSLVSSTASFNPDLMKEQDEFPWKMFGVATLGFWIFYVLSAFLILLLLNWVFKKLFANAIKSLDEEFWKGLGYGLIYLLGIPILIALTFVIIIGIPIGLFVLVLFLFSLVFGHLVAASLFTHYWNHRVQANWGFWRLVFLALGIAILFRLLTLIPFLGVLISIVLLAVSYGAIILTIFPKKANITAVH